MNEQTIILIFLVMALVITLWLYILKAIKQVNYKGDERWKLIQLKANNAANLAHSILIVLIAVLPFFYKYANNSYTPTSFNFGFALYWNTQFN